MKAKKIINDINGLIVLNKPKNFTSNDCLSIIKKHLHQRKIGHTGTLDVNATGVLVCLLGNATKCQEYLMKSGEKVYDAEVIFGIATDTEDITGQIVNKYEGDFSKLSLENLSKSMKKFIGEYKQTPPMYSAKKVNGKKLINLARKGITVDRKVCDVTIHDIELLELEDYVYNKQPLKKANIRVRCSKGTYIRTLCKDIGMEMNIPSCMGNLNRVQTGNFKINDSVTLDEIKQKYENNDLSFIKPCFFQERKSAVTFGKFETLHLGHQLIIKKLVKISKEKNLNSTVLIVGNREKSKILSDEQRISKLKFLGVNNIFYFDLNENNKNMSAENFVKDILDKQLKTKYIIVGSDCSFGYKGFGDSSLLKKISKELNIEVETIDKLKIDNTDIDISSTYINIEYEKGNNEVVNKLLGKG